MKKKILKTTFNIILTLVIVLSIYSISQQSKYKIQTTYTSEYTVDSILKLDIVTKKGNKPVEAESLNVSIYNKYNKNDTIDSQLSAYEPGKYMLIISPQFTGDYIVNINMVHDSITTVLGETFNIK